MKGEMKRVEEILKTLQERDFKLTPQRQVVVETLLEHPGRHLTAEDIYHLVKEKHPEISLATVYRTLELLAGINMLIKIDLGGRFRRYSYELSTETRHHHHHLICLGCGRVDEFAEDLLESLEEQVARRNGFRVTDHQVKFYGYCRDCQGKQGNKGNETQH